MKGRWLKSSIVIVLVMLIFICDLIPTAKYNDVNRELLLHNDFLTKQILY